MNDRTCTHETMLETELLGDNYSQVTYKTMMVPEEHTSNNYWHNSYIMYIGTLQWVPIWEEVANNFYTTQHCKNWLLVLMHGRVVTTGLLWY